MSEFFRLRKLVGLGAALAISVAAPIAHISTPAYAQAVASFSRIDVSGNVRIAADTVRVIADLPTGTSVTPGQINEAKQRLVASGLFASVEVFPERGRLMIKVVENPAVLRDIVSLGAER